MKTLTCLIFSALALCIPAFSQDSAEAERPSQEERLARLLQRFPESDANKDGKLTQEEAREYARSQKGENRKGKQPERPGRAVPTHPDIAYGGHPKQRFDIWPVPDADSPTPLVIYIHGGGFRGGDKSGVAANIVKKFHDAGIAFASLNYRLSDVGPYPIMMEDAARGLQTIRSRAKEWNLDPERIACYGGSAGAGISLWLGFHDDLADPESDDPIARQSTRIVAAGTMNGQSTYDMRTFRDWFSVPNLKPHDALVAFYDVNEDSDWDTDRVKGLMTEASAITHLTNDDVPVYMVYGRENTPVDENTSEGAWVHHVLLGLKLQEAMRKLELECIVSGPDVKPDNDPYGSLEDFLVAKLKP